MNIPAGFATLLAIFATFRFVPRPALAGSPTSAWMASRISRTTRTTFATVASLEDPAPALPVYVPWRHDPEGLHDKTQGADFVEAFPIAGFLFTPEVIAVLIDYFPFPEDVVATQELFLRQPERYREYYGDFVFDPIEVTDALIEAEITPREVAQGLLDDMPRLTRLRSSVSPTEMTLDPDFGFNPDLPTVQPSVPLRRRSACDENPNPDQAFDAPQQLIWETGQTLRLPSLAEMSARGQTYADLVELDSAAALYIEEMSA